MAVATRGLVVVAGLLGAVGVAAAAATSHGESRNLGAIAQIALSHGPALLALALFGRGKALLISAGLLAAGTLLFVGDLLVREWMGQGIFPGAAPLGGGAMVMAWLGIALCGALALPRN